jgi:cob(I)alamin adenosyltransferase
MKIYTKTGDLGETGLFRGPRVLKNDPRVEAYGNVDELNAVLGIALKELHDPQILDLVPRLQHELFEVGADLATPPQDKEDPTLRISAGMVTRLEQAIDHFENKLPELTEFILPGGSSGGAWLHYARTVCRRAERSIVELRQKEEINAELLRYVNRLSDLLFVLARAENQTNKTADVIWKRRRFTM